MKFCTKCGNQMEDNMVFCQKCGEKAIFSEENSSVKSENTGNSAPIHNPFEENTVGNSKMRTSMKVWMIIFFVFAGISLIGAISDPSMLASVLLFGILGVMFLFLAKTPKESKNLFTGAECFKKTGGIPKGAFVGISVFLAVFSLVVISSAFDTETQNEKSNTAVVSTDKEEKPKEKKPDIPVEFADDCPVVISASMYDNIIGFPELKCNIKNKTDKEISAIQFYLIPKDVYGEEVTGIFAQNRLQCDSPISANGSDTIAWQMLEQEVKSGELYVYSVYFSDGTEWGDRNAPTSKIKKYSFKMQVSY